MGGVAVCPGLFAFSTVEEVRLGEEILTGLSGEGFYLLECGCERFLFLARPLRPGPGLAQGVPGLVDASIDGRAQQLDATLQANAQ